MKYSAVSAPLISRSPLQDEIKMLLNKTSKIRSELGALVLVAGIMVYTEEIRTSSWMSLHEVNEITGPILDEWSFLYLQTEREESAVNSVAYPAAFHLRLSLYVDMKIVMRFYLERHFVAVRETSRNGDLAMAARCGLDALVPWTFNHTNQISMVALPCAIVVSEYLAMILELERPDESGRMYVRDMRRALFGVTGESIRTISALWKLLRLAIERGPVTMSMAMAMDDYSTYLSSLGVARRSFANLKSPPASCS